MPAHDDRHPTARDGAAAAERLERRVLCAADAAPAVFAPLPPSPALYQLLARGQLTPAGDADFFALGRLRAGDVVSVALSGAGSSRGSLSDPHVTLYSATGDTAVPVAVARNDDGGSVRDALVLRHVVSADGSFIVRVLGSSALLAGTYELAAWLEAGSGGGPPAGSAGSPGAAAPPGESEPNNQFADAGDLSAAWRSVRYAASQDGSVEPRVEGARGLPADQLLELRAGDLLSVVVDSTSTLDAAVSVLDESGGELLAIDLGDSDRGPGDPGDARVLAFAPPRDGVYRVRVRANDATSGSYRLDAYLSRFEASVVARHVFYDNSHFDGRAAGPGPADDGAVAPDKAALLPGRAPTPENVTNFSRGINGVMFDVEGLRGDLGAGDVAADVAAPGGAGAWVAAPPPSVARRDGAGAGGSDRFTLTWPGGTIVNCWLRVTVKASPANGLAADDVFLFGNLVGETGDGGGRAAVTASDVVRTRAALASPAGISSRFDFNRDGRVDATDQAVVRAQCGRTLQPPWATAAPIAEPLSTVPTGRRVRAATTRRAWAEIEGDVLS